MNKFKDKEYGDLSGQEIIINSLCLSHKSLKSLEGSPEILRGVFNIRSNKLVNLKYSPREIYGDVYFDNNSLENLEGDLVMVDGNLNISYNPLKSFKGSLRKVTGNLYATKLPEFSSKEEIEDELMEANTVVGGRIYTSFGSFKQDSSKVVEYHNKYRISILQKFL